MLPLIQLNAFIQLEGEAKGTSLAANANSRQAFTAQVRASEWMIVTDAQTKRERWDLVRSPVLRQPHSPSAAHSCCMPQNVVGRFIAFPSSDLQANADINVDLSKLADATSDFTGPDDLTPTIDRLRSNGSATGPNAGPLNGNSTLR